MVVCKRCGYTFWGGSSPGRVVYLDNCLMCTGINNTGDKVSTGRDREMEERLAARTGNLLQLHADGCLPRDTALVHMPIERTDRGDYRVILPPPGTGSVPGWAEEHAEEYAGLYLRWYVVRGQHFFAGYDDASGTLVIGVESSCENSEAGGNRLFVEGDC